MASRRYPRIRIDCPLSFSTDESSGGVFTQDKGITCDLSWNGCAIQSPTQVDKGSYLQMRIALPGHDVELNIELAKVRWATEQSFGVEFLVLTRQQQARLRGFVTSHDDDESLAS